MLPVLLDLGFIKIYTYGVFVTLAFFWSTFFLWKNITMTSHKEDEIFDGVFIALLGGVFVGRLEHVILNFSDFGYNLLKFILINGYPGIGELGFVAGIILTLAIFCSVRKIEYMNLIDYSVPPLLLAIAIAKLGAFFAGSLIGTQTRFFLSLAYPNLDGMRHLTALYESILFFAGSFFAFKILRSIRRNNLFEGFNLLFFVWYFSLITVLFDPITAFRPMVQGIGFDLIVGGVLLLTSSVYVIYHFRKLIRSSFLQVIKQGKAKKK